MKRTLVVTLVALGALVACGAPKEEKRPAMEKKPATPAKPAEEAAAASNYKGMAVTDGGQVSGTVTYAGTETDATLEVTKDKDTCLPAGATTLPAETLVVTDGKLSNVIVWLDGVTAGKSFEPATVVLDNKGCHFVPHVAVGHVGGKVVAKNSDPILHNTHLTLREGGKTLANIALPQQGQESEKPLKKAGLIDVTCDAHEWMKAYVLVADHPYAAVTGADGSYSFTDVPAGTYTVKFWHERLGEKTAPATVSAGATATADAAY